MVYERLPERIVVSPVAPIAMEYGRWQGASAAAPEDFAAGSYAAKWRCFGGEWKIEAETYLTEACGGAFC